MEIHTKGISDLSTTKKQSEKGYGTGFEHVLFVKICNSNKNFLPADNLH